MGALTDRQIKTTKAQDKDQFLGDGGGLYLRVTPAGARLWVYRYKNSSNSTRWLDLGTYPAISLAEARVEATKLKFMRRSGLDPHDERQREQEAQKAARAAEAADLAALNARALVSDLFEQWLKRDVAKRKDGGAETRRMFEKDVLPKLGSLAVADVRKVHIATVVDDVLARGGNGRMAAVALAGMRQMFLFAVERDLIESDPTAAIRKSRIHKATERDRVLSSTEIRLLADRLPQAGMTDTAQTALLAILATCCRIGELCNARVSEIDLAAGTWRIPADNAKNGNEHTVYLSDFASDLFRKLTDRARTLSSEWLLPATNKPGPVCKKSLTKQVADRQRGNKAPMKGRSPRTEALVLPGGPWTPHDLRRTGATMMGELGVRPDVIEHCLNHTEQNRMKRIYQRHSYADEMRQGWQLLGERLELLLTHQSANIHLLRRTA